MSQPTTIAIQLYILTDRPGQAAQDLVGCALDVLPRWLAVLSTFDAIIALPDRAPCLLQFYGPRCTTEADLAAFQRRYEGAGLDLDWVRDTQRISDWCRRRDAAELAKAMVGEAECTPAPVPAALQPASIPAPAGETSPKRQKWI